MLLIRFNIETEFGHHFSKFKCIDMKKDDFVKWFRSYYYNEIEYENERIYGICFKLHNDLEFYIEETDCDNFEYIDNMINDIKFSRKEIFNRE